MNYIIDYELCSLIFLLIILFRFNIIPKFQNKSNFIFQLILIVVIANISLDSLSAILIKNANIVPLWLNYLVNTLFYSLQVIMPVLLWLYVLVLSSNELTKKRMWFFLPSVFFELIVLLNPIFKWIFYFDEYSVYTHGPYFLLIYIETIFYFVLTVVLVIKNRQNLRKIEIQMIIGFIIAILIAMLIQYFYPQLLLTGVAMAVSIFIMFLTIQNPEVMIDPITGVYNYNSFYEYMRIIISSNKEMFMVVVDIGEIRRTNSTMGIQAGNQLLTQAVEYMKTIFGPKAKLFRLIGTRFIILIEDNENNKKLVSDISTRFKEPWIYKNRTVYLLATIRYLEQNLKFTSPHEIIDLIDLVYSKTHEEGFGTTKPIILNQYKQLHRKEQIQEALRNALANKTGFYINYQPMYCVSGKKFCGIEALLRFKDDKLGQISPSEFIPIAEASGLIYEIDKLVVRMACDFIKKHPEIISSGLKIVEINLSASEFNKVPKDLLNEIKQNITTIESNICFEVTETAITSNREVILDFMNELKSLGVKFAIDDFGTGYANIIQLLKLPFNVVKLDKVFVTQCGEKESNMLKDLMRMFKNIGLSTVIEGIETQSQVDFATSLNIDEIQGYFYSYPLSEEELLSFVKYENK